jgi:hypothetical protein
MFETHLKERKSRRKKVRQSSSPRIQFRLTVQVLVVAHGGLAQPALVGQRACLQHRNVWHLIRLIHYARHVPLAARAVTAHTKRETGWGSAHHVGVCDDDPAGPERR